ncbi:metastasis-associated protein MTA2 isoform X2 [Latimeria chalumnae]|uniref:metastasis-associated protein MTA2 isoform X2 n=1 Tax=Latimeria chalumnae TaxID=7897 RepID=UPI00313E82ED
MAANMYRVGDYVYFENSSSNPYLIRRIEELNKTANGNVEAKVVCLFRRRDISSNLNSLADSNAREFEEESKQPSVSEQQRHQLKHRELFLSRQFESLPATHIRGKCSVTLLNETDILSQYLDKEDCFFYSLVFDPVQKTLLADQGEIRVGSKFQAEIPDKIDKADCTRVQEKLETKVWDPSNPLTDRQIDQFLVVARAIGTFARALDCSSSIRQPSLHMSAAAASRDITLFHAMDTLQKNGYDLSKAMSTLVPQGGPVLCRDEMEEWSASEAMLFEEALEKYGKDFNDIRQDFLPWKSLASIVQFYYMWKTTDRYIQQKRLKAAEADSKLKQVYIPTYTKPNPNQIISVGSKPGVNGAGGFQKGLTCESCHTTQSAQWYAWGPPNMQCRLCASCWIYWKKYGGLKTPTQLDGAARGGMEPHSRTQLARPDGHSLSQFTSSANRAKLLAKNRQTFLLQTTKLTRIARRMCRDILQPRRAARRPYAPINANAIKAECAVRLPKSAKTPLKIRATTRVPLATIVKELAAQAPLKSKPPRGTKTPINRNQVSQNRGTPNLLVKRPFESNQEYNTWVDQPGSKCSPYKYDDLEESEEGQGNWLLRKALTQLEMRRAARRPNISVRVKPVLPARPLQPPTHPASTTEPIVLED